TENYLAKEFIPTFSFSNTSITLANDFDAAIMEVYYLVAAQHQEKGRLAEAAKWAEKVADLFDTPALPVSPNTSRVAGILLEAGKTEKSLRLLEGLAERVLALYRKTSATDLILTLDHAQYYLDLIKVVLKKNNLESKKIDEVIKSIENE
ncbi:MAG: hypothetical protein JNM88_10275, partial [Chitinophagaceae bacterium]|nr:hypothetical protein [Chitinophagaceae bacterium]